MLRITTVSLPPGSRLPRTVPGPVEALLLIDGMDWAGLMTGWLRTQEGPLPAIVLADAGRSAELHVSRIPGDEDPYDQLHLQRTTRQLLGVRRFGTLTAEIRTPEALRQCLAHLHAGDVEGVDAAIRAHGTSILG